MSTPAAAPSAVAREVRLLRTAAAYELRKHSAFRAGFLVREVLRGADRGVVMIFVYAALFRSSGATQIRGYSFDGMVAYLILVAVVGKLLFHERALDLSDQIFEGWITKFVVMPVRYFTLVAGRWIQYMAVQSVVAIGLWAAGSLLLRRWWPDVTLGRLAMAVVLVVLASWCFLLLYFIIHSAAFWLDVVWTLLAMSRMVCSFVMGELVPISLMPRAVESFFRLLFPYWGLCGPVEILLGRQDAADFREGLVVLVLSAAVLQVLALATWKRGLRRYGGAGA